MSEHCIVLQNPDDLSGLDIVMEAPEKEDGRMMSWMSAGERAIFLQTPRMTVMEIEENGLIRCRVAADGPLARTIRLIESKVLDAVDSRSQEFFKRRLNREFLVESYDSSLRSADDEGGSGGLTFSFLLHPAIRVRNQYGADKAVGDVVPGTSIAALIEITGAAFEKRSWSLTLSGRQVKLYSVVEPPADYLDMTVGGLPPQPDDREGLQELISGAVEEEYAHQFYDDER